MRGANPDLHIILLTGRASVEQSIEAMKLGAVDVLEKPADIGVLVRTIDEASSRKDERARLQLEKQLSDILRKKGW